MNGPIARAELEVGRTQYAAMQQLVHRTVGLRRGEASAGPWRVPYVRCGRGPKLLLIHGFGDRKGSWSPLLLLLHRHFDCVAPDLLGFGESPAVASEHMLPREQARMLAGLLDSLETGDDTGPVHVVGQSMGAMVAAYLALERAERVATLTLISPAGPAGLAPELQMAVAGGDNPLLAKDFAGFERLLKLSMARRPPFPRPMRRFLAHQWAARHDEHTRHWERLLAVTLDELRPPATPELLPRSLLIYGEHERVVHTDNVDVYRDWFPRIRVEHLKGVGHNPHHEATNRVARLIREHARRYG